MSKIKCWVEISVHLLVYTYLHAKGPTALHLSVSGIQDLTRIEESGKSFGIVTIKSFLKQGRSCSSHMEVDVPRTSSLMQGSSSMLKLPEGSLAITTSPEAGL